jgi:hypothetical protein
MMPRESCQKRARENGRKIQKKWMDIVCSLSNVSDNILLIARRSEEEVQYSETGLTEKPKNKAKP